jgi:subtilisin family serine protease
MPRLAVTRVLVAFIASAFFTPAAFAASAGASRYVPGELLVIRKPGGALEARAGGEVRALDGRLAAVLSRHGIGRWQGLGATPGGAGESSAWVKLVSTRADFDPVAAARELTATGTVVAAAPNLRLRLYPTIPNDVYFGDQYWAADLHDSDVQLTTAWDIERGDTSVTIGVMDTGVDRGHPDLSDKIWRNWDEIPGNGIDDDGDGHIDDVNGWDFGNEDNDPDPEPFFDEVTGIDVAFHGTFCSALAAASSNNAEGIAGAAWNCRVVPLKVADSNSQITLAATTGAFRYAWMHHVSVLNMSLGTADTTSRAYFQALVDSATAGGVVCVAAAGNDSTSRPNYPASCTSVLSVGATDDLNHRAEFSNYGPTVDVAAPGYQIWSAINQNYVVDEFSQVFYIFLFGWDEVHPYMYGNGTSFSCPITAGVCGMVRSRYPQMTPLQVIQHVIDSGDDVAYDQPIGRKLNALRAVSGTLSVPVADRIVSAKAWPNPFRADASIGFTLPRAGETRVTLYDATGRWVRTLVLASLPAGPNQARWDGRLASGGAAATGLYFAHIEAPGFDRTLRIVRVE